jgi:hypothetical protein
MKWAADGSVCPACGGIGRKSARYPAALCRSCENELVDAQGRKATAQGAKAKPGEAPWGTGLVIEVAGQELPEDTPIYARGVECRAREGHIGGIVVQPVEAWQRKV